jgi:predicted nucleic acid-binding protein
MTRAERSPRQRRPKAQVVPSGRLTVFVDTSAIAALLWAPDEHHEEAVQTWAGLRARGARPTTTSLVIAETVALVQSRAGFDRSVEAGDRLLGAAFEVVWVDRSIADDAWAIYRRYNDQVLSFCDCASFVVMRRQGLDPAFSYDDDFMKMGFTPARAD